MELEVVEHAPPLTLAYLRGRMDSQGAEGIELKINATLLRGGDCVLDLSGVTFLASLGIRVLISAAKQLDRRGAKLVLVAPRELVDQALRHSSIDEIIPVVASADEARALLAH